MCPVRIYLLALWINLEMKNHRLTMQPFSLYENRYLCIIRTPSFYEEEIIALSAIFGEEWILECDNRYSIRICNSSGNEVYFQITLPENYPLYAPPTYQISAPWMTRAEKSKLSFKIESIYSQNRGECIIHLWIEEIRNFINEETRLDNASLTNVLANSSFTKDVDVLPAIEHGEPISDRKSVFQAHLARIGSVAQVKQVLDKLKENRKIAAAKHNIYAYRIADLNKGSFIQDCDDDGETRAGPGLLNLLQVMDVSNVLVVVTRWYGGIHLGSDRFKHINNAAGTLIKKLGMLKK